MKQLLRRSNDASLDNPSSPTHGNWSPLSNTTLDQLLAARLQAFGTANMCSERILAVMQREDVCAIRFQEVNRTGALDKTSTLRLHFAGDKVDAIDEYIDARRSFGYEKAVGAEPIDTMAKPISAM